MGEQPVVVGVDASGSARIAGEWAVDLAAGWDVPLHLVHVVREPAPPEPPAWLAELAAAAERIGARCTVDVVRGEVGAVLVERSAGARLMVLGSYGSGAHTGLLTGTLGLALLEWAPCPIAVVRGPAFGVPPANRGPLLVGVDGTAAGRAALAVAADLAEPLAATVRVVHAWTELETSPSVTVHRRVEVAEAESGAVLDADLRWITALRPGLAVTGELVNDTSMRALLDRAAAARAVVVGHRRGTPHSELQPGSTAVALTAFAPCPVVVLGPRCLASEDDAAGPDTAAVTTAAVTLPRPR